MALKLSLYDVIKKPVFSNKAFLLKKKLNQVVFEVHPSANKSLVKEAAEKILKVQVSKVCILIRKGKRKTSRKRNVFFDALQKRAIITLKEGSSISLFDEGMGKNE